MSNGIVDKLRDLGVTECKLEQYAKILTGASTPKEAEAQMLGYSAGYFQVMLPMFRVLYQEPYTKEAVHKELEPTGVPKDIIDDFFMRTGDQPYTVFHLTHQEIPAKTRDQFVDSTKEVMLRYVKKAVCDDNQE